MFLFFIAFLSPTTTYKPKATKVYVAKDGYRSPMGGGAK